MSEKKEVNRTKKPQPHKFIILRFISITLILLIFSQTINSQNSFSAKLNIPNETVQGETTVFKLDIFKPENIRAYTVFKQQFPKGFYVEAKDLNGAEFSYENNLLTLTWLRISGDSKVSVVYEVSSLYGVTGKFKFSGNLTYLIGHKLGKFDLKNYELNVLKEKRLVPNNIIANYDPVIKVTGNSYKDVSCTGKQTFNKKKNVYEIELKIKKKDAGSYNIVEKIPSGFNFTEHNSAGAKVFKSKDKIQFYWESIPESKEVIIKYWLKPADGETSPPKLQGKLSFIVDNQIVNIPIIHE
ncbi:MAG: hypothetical protein K8R54_15880 [Bacteroidales bacterium]|nr:hypothetical protein [Bacteroidales bacterium]